ncbi:hypothetical protein F5Y14DRAFT_446798 [Nemania sp. NC0429]|nr:hypothetical protein F5Y14DRAFT_446798 [Nemania sp. NC0429]
MVSEALEFYDIYSLDDPDMMGHEDASRDWHAGAGPEEPVLWFQQTVIHGCGLIGLLHCVANGLPSELVVPGSDLASFLGQTISARHGKESPAPERERGSLSAERGRGAEG